MKKELKLAGSNLVNQFSNDGSIAAVANYKAGFRVFDLATEKIIFKTTIKEKGYSAIYHIDISDDNHYAAFSCYFKVFVVDLIKKEVVKEIKFNQQLERQHTLCFSFFGKANKLAIPDGEQVILYTIESDSMDYLALPEKSGFTNNILVDRKDNYLIYKSGNSSHNEEVYIYDLNTGKQKGIISLPYEYVPGGQMFWMQMQFLADNKLAVFSKSSGLSLFEIPSGKLVENLSWETMGFRTLHNINKSRISPDGRYILIKRERPTNGGQDLTDWSVSYPDGFDFVIYDREKKSIIKEIKNGDKAGDIHLNKLVYIESIRDDKNRRKQILVVESF